MWFSNVSNFISYLLKNIFWKYYTPYIFAKNIKQLKSTIGSLFVLIILFGCKSKDKKEPVTTDAAAKTETVTTASIGSGTKTAGVLGSKKEDGGIEGETVGTVYEFEGNKLNMGKDGVTLSGSTAGTDNTFSFLADGGSDKIMYNYYFSGDTMVMSMQEGIQVFHLVNNWK